MRLRNTLLLAVVLILLATYVYFFELQKGTKEKTEKLLSFKEEEVQGLVLNYPDREIRLQRDLQGRWRIVHPLEAAADDATVGAILSALNTSEVKRTIEEKPTEADLQNYGLDKPEVKALVSLRNGIALPPIFVGATTPVGNSAYIRRGADAGVLLTDASLRSSLDKTLNDLRSKRIMEFGPDAVKQLEIRTPKDTLVLTKGEKEEWRAEGPKRGRVREGAVSDYLTLLSRLRANGFADDEAKDLRKYGLDSPSLKISTADKERKSLGTLLVGSKIGTEYYAAREGNATVYTIDEFSHNQLNKQATDFLEEEKKASPAASGAKK